jgi:hypothetical protein
MSGYGGGRGGFTRREWYEAQGYCLSTVTQAPEIGSVQPGFWAVCPLCAKKVKVTIKGEFTRHKAVPQ